MDNAKGYIQNIYQPACQEHRPLKREREVPRSPFCARISPFGFWIMREREGMDLRYWVSDTIRVHEELTRTDEFVY